jgi:hypothetical protein
VPLLRLAPVAALLLLAAAPVRPVTPPPVPPPELAPFAWREGETWDAPDLQAFLAARGVPTDLLQIGRATDPNSALRLAAAVRGAGAGFDHTSFAWGRLTVRGPTAAVEPAAAVLGVRSP